MANAGVPLTTTATTSERPGRSGGWFKAYKRGQGTKTRLGTFVGSLALVFWGALFLSDKLSIYQGDKTWQLLVSKGIPIVIPALVGFFCWWITYAHRTSSDFMIATEGEMKKVNWPTKRELIGSTKVVILFTAIMAILLFSVDLLFMNFFEWIGVLRSS